MIGDTTSHGGRVITDSEGHAINGKSIARLHDLADCPVKYPDGRPHGVNKIIEAIRLSWIVPPTPSNPLIRQDQGVFRSLSPGSALTGALSVSVSPAPSRLGEKKLPE
nr:PAAR domain-containing protein [Burkholderia ubonensis]